MGLQKNGSCLYNRLEEQVHGQANFAPVLESYQAVLLMFLGFGGLSITMGVVHRAIRKFIYHDDHNLDTVFDAGGRVTLSLTSVTVTSQLLWPSDFLQSATLMAKTGLGGSLFFAIAIVLDIMVFPLLSLTLKSRAPGAKTFLQIINARFGKTAHIVFCCIALICNLITLMGLILAARAALHVLVKDVSDEMVLLILAFLFGSYCMIGGLGTTFYISYFTTALTYVSVLIFIIYVTYLVPESTFISRSNIYEALTCLKGPDGNFESSYMTFKSRGGVIYGIVMLLMSCSISFTDQANWQSRIAAKPAQGVAGFFIAAYLWYGIPLTITTATSSIYLSMSYQNGTHLLSSSDIDSGFITPYVMQTIMGNTGAFMLITMVTMSLMSTGSGEVMAISSILIYDIYKVYINPFRKDYDISKCPLCGNKRLSMHIVASEVFCCCQSVTTCEACESDLQQRNTDEHQPVYKCKVHGSFRAYEDSLLRHKSWCMIWVTVCIIPYGLLIINSGVNLNWTIMTLHGWQSVFLFPLLLTTVWTKCTSKGVISGSVFGTIAYFAGLFIVTELVYEDGLRNFMVNTTQDYSILGAIVSGLSVSVILTVFVSLCTNKIKTGKDVEKEWEKTLCIDNPLNPWRRVYTKELNDINVGEDVVVTLSHMSSIFKRTRRFAAIGGGFSVCLFGVVLPASVLTLDVLSYSQFSGWITSCQIWVMIAAAFAIIIPPIEEIVQIVKAYKWEKQSKCVYQDINMHISEKEL